MKRLSLFVLVLFAISCKQEEKPDYSVINGTVENNTAETALIRGNDFEASFSINEKGVFTDTLHIKVDGFYDLSVGRERTEIYLEKGKNLSVNLNADEFDESLKYSGDLANINNFLAAKYLWNEQKMDNKEVYLLDENKFKERLDQNQKSIDSLYVVNKIENENFKAKLADEDNYSHALMVENYKDAHRYYSGDETYRVSGDFYDGLKDINFKDTLAFRNSVGYQNLLEAHFNRLVNEETFESGNNNQTVMYLKKVNEALPNGYAKDKMMSSYLRFGLKPDETLDEAYNIYKNSNPNPENLATLTERYNKLKTITAGNPSPTFNYENHKGGTTDLATLKGKYVYIDVWATWCGPCLREIPALKEVEKDYHNKNVDFVSLSIDEPKDYDKWKAMVSEKELGGIQLMADNNWKSKFVEDYAIMGIPRFILIDPQGNIISADAPRPSDPKLRKIFDGLM
ncbi:TlpA family protein disulfide reductase [Aequorivita antarctica]|uniref:TlpA family protein disulfide reductase n=1 Tax=Aequorivita antarctica TaxID=153266 RepID=A0A5C6Z2K8_9FLAO|nr:TlpA disulfide reductase family protein [Aequorivita antarctica]TXD74361.1 TlpA family protein disulfide reductase [Aequorivita antarctica]SRX73714.1 Thiol:disulfide interchange protein TlpA [Aequorivita antarctica]